MACFCTEHPSSVLWYVVDTSMPPRTPPSTSGLNPSFHQLLRVLVATDSSQLSPHSRNRSHPMPHPKIAPIWGIKAGHVGTWRSFCQSFSSRFPLGSGKVCVLTALKPTFPHHPILPFPEVSILILPPGKPLGHKTSGSLS